MKLLRRSPAHGLVSQSMLLIPLTGRKSGMTCTTPVDSPQEVASVSIYTHASCWKNLNGGTPVTHRLRRRDVRGLAEPVADSLMLATARARHVTLRTQVADSRGITGVRYPQTRSTPFRRAGCLV